MPQLNLSAIISYIPQIHQIALTIDIAKKMDEKRYYCITFPYFLTDKERYNLLDCFRMRIIEESRFFFFDVEDPALNQKL